jgi:predicted PurR-regulated permease PerM
VNGINRKEKRIVSMKWKVSSPQFRWGLTALLVIIAGISFFFLFFRYNSILNELRNLINILMPVLIGLVMAYLMAPVLNFMERKLLVPICQRFHWKESPKRKSFIRSFGILFTVILVVFLIYIIIAMLLSQIIPSVQSIIANFDTYVNNFTIWINQDLLSGYPEVKNFVLRNVDEYSAEIESYMNNTVLPYTTTFIKNVSLSVISLIKALWNFIIGFVISIYVLASKERFAGQAKKIAYALWERSTANTIIHNFRFTHNTFIKFINGEIWDALIIGVLCFIGTSIMRTPYPALISVIVGVTNIIPFFGPFLGAIPSAILILLVDVSHPLTCVYFLIFLLCLQQFDGNLIKPKVLGESIGISGFWVIFSIMVFGGLYGILGMIIGVPIFAVVYAAISSLVNSSLRKKKMPADTKLYVHVAKVDEDGFHENYEDAVSNRNVSWKQLSRSVSPKLRTPQTSHEANETNKTQDHE